jgi:hypothetical protein
VYTFETLKALLYKLLERYIIAMKIKVVGTARGYSSFGDHYTGRSGVVKLEGKVLFSRSIRTAIRCVIASFD